MLLKTIFFTIQYLCVYLFPKKKKNTWEDIHSKRRGLLFRKERYKKKKKKWIVVFFYFFF